MVITQMVLDTMIKNSIPLNQCKMNRPLYSIFSLGLKKLSDLFIQLWNVIITFDDLSKSNNVCLPKRNSSQYDKVISACQKFGKFTLIS